MSEKMTNEQAINEIVDAYKFCIENPFVNGSLIEVNGGYCYK